ncbi:hypothetical protein BTM25_43880 [Actinomadura rubteroloni]|uniref:DUF3105 domain-containing protein n=1 Tax=Actinomadura rubteroloni TaxID=1926885 RepID=A0A2P4UDW0_9ACTN|nr:DUF3105 domain-containing protein [Actinomadura rubteroloni]POM23235.1 hypothetical protein BTM25_43880 [Actinomadura rubteroloni]
MPANTRARARKNVLTERRTPWGSIAFFTVVGLIAVAAIAVAFVRSRPAGDGDGIAGLVVKDDLSQNHTTGPVRYPDSPPMGGDHDPTWQNCDARVYTAPLRNENAVHALEHGAVWIAYRPGLAAAQVDALARRIRAVDYSLMSPYPDLSAPIALTAWGRQLKVTDANDPRIDAFMSAFVKGPQTPEPGAPCSGGKDAP